MSLTVLNTVHGMLGLLQDHLDLKTEARGPEGVCGVCVNKEKDAPWFEANEPFLLNI